MKVTDNSNVKKSNPRAENLELGTCFKYSSNAKDVFIRVTNGVVDLRRGQLYTGESASLDSEVVVLDAEVIIK